jgi:hypothetical protein
MTILEVCPGFSGCASLQYRSMARALIDTQAYLAQRLLLQGPPLFLNR